MTRHRIVCLFMAATSMACSTPLSRGIRAYDAGVHPLALQHLMEAETGMSDARGRRRVRYALYRGLVHMSLGDMQSAEVWLAEAKAAVDRDRDILDAVERGKLTTAWISIGHEPGTWGASVMASR